jgi:hypothetical protein
VLVGIIGFVAGMQYQKHGSTTNASFNTSGRIGMMGNAGGPGMMGNGQGQIGSFGIVTAVSSTSITIKDQMRSQSSTYTIGSDTTVTNNGSSAQASDIKTGDTAMVQTSSNNTKQASQIIINPSMGPGVSNTRGSGNDDDNGPSMRSAPANDDSSTN